VKGSFKKRTYADRRSGAKRSATTWTVTYDEPIRDGEPRRQRRKAGFATRKDAEKWFDKKKAQLERGFTGIDERATVESYLKHWLSNASVGAGTLRMYESYARRFVYPVLGTIRLCDLTPSHLEQAKRTWALRRRHDGNEDAPIVSSKSIRHAWTVLAVALNRAKKQQIISFNPCEYVNAPRVERREMRALDANAAGLYIQAFSGDPDMGAAIILAIGSGLRRGELLALRWSDIDLDTSTIRVNRSLECITIVDLENPENRTPKLRFKEPKTTGSRRLIPLPKFAIKRLRQHRREQKKRFDTLNVWRTNDSLVFDRAGEPWNPNTFGSEFAKRARRLKLPSVRLHDLRHSYATLMLESGVDLKTVSHALGHSTIRITADTYAHVTPAMQQSAAERLDRIIGDTQRR
jgi:integrase